MSSWKKEQQKPKPEPKVEEVTDADVISTETEESEPCPDYEKLIESLTNKVVNLAVKIDAIEKELAEHKKTPDAHHVAMIAGGIMRSRASKK